MRCPLSLKSARVAIPSEGQAALTGGVGQGRDAAVVLVPGTVEDDGLDARTLRALGHELTDALGLGRLVAAERAQVGLHAGGSHQGAPEEVVDHLDADVLRRTG